MTAQHGLGKRHRRIAVALALLLTSLFSLMPHPANATHQDVVDPRVPVSISIQALKISAPVIQLGLTTSRTLDTPKKPGLAGWWRGGTLPGERGPTVIAAHVQWNRTKGAFYNLAKAQSGQIITITRANKTVVRYRVTKVAQYAKKSFPTRDVYGPTAVSELRLITCARKVGTTYRDNIVVFARIVL